MTAEPDIITQAREFLRDAADDLLSSPPYGFTLSQADACEIGVAIKTVLARLASPIVPPQLATASRWIETCTGEETDVGKALRALLEAVGG